MQAGIKEYARRLGADLVGFCSAEPFSAEQAYYQERSGNGLISPFVPSRMAEGFYPEGLLPGARSFIVVGLSYYHEIEGDSSLDPGGRLARYARVKDYHQIIGGILEGIVHYIEKNWEDGFSWRAFVDTGPVPEKAIAARAGLGFLGRNNLLISPVFGSWLVFGEVLTDIEFEPDLPLENGCTGCQKCQEACPTGAIGEGSGYDPDSCLSYLTQADQAPERVYRKFADRLWGCDSCQEACPYNKNANKATNPLIAATYLGPEIELDSLVELSNKQFRRSYRDFPFSWRGNKPLLRNAAVIIGNLADGLEGEEDYLRYSKLLEPLEKDDREEVRRAAQWAKKRLNQAKYR